MLIIEFYKVSIDFKSKLFENLKQYFYNKLACVEKYRCYPLQSEKKTYTN